MDLTKPAASACGIYDCPTCEHRLSDACPGCRDGNLREGEGCAVFACVESRGIAGCRDCPEVACALRRSAESVCPLRSRFEKKRWWGGRISRALEIHRGVARDEVPSRMPHKVINRLRWYLTALDTFAPEDGGVVSSWQLAEKVGVTAALIRKDLSRFGEFGTPSFGYRVDFLRERIRSILGLDRPMKIAWVGACSVRHSAAAVERITAHNFSVVAVFDTDPDEIGTTVGGHTVMPASDIRNVLAGKSISAAVIAVPGAPAREIARELVELGAQAVLNMSGELLALPAHVKVSSLDLAGELLELCYYCGETDVVEARSGQKAIRGVE